MGGGGSDEVLLKKKKGGVSCRVRGRGRWREPGCRAMSMIAVGLETDSLVRSTRAQDVRNVDEKAVQQCDWPARGGLKTSQKV